MGTYRQRFLYNFATLVTLLACEARVDSNDLMTSSLSLIFKNIEKRAPAGVHDAFCEMMVFDHAVDVQVLNGNVMILVGVLLSRLEVKITALTCYLEMRLGSIAGCLTASLASLLAAAQLTLFAPQGFLRGAIVSWVLYRLPKRVGKEDFQADVNTNIRVRTFGGKVFRLRHCLAHDESVPMPVSTQDKMDCLGLALDRTMEFDFERPTKLLGDKEMFLVRSEPDITVVFLIAILPELNGVPAIGTFEAREPNPLVQFFTRKKPFESLAEAIGKRLHRGSRDMFTTASLEGRREIILAWERAFVLILCLDSLKHLIIDEARLFQALHEQVALLLIRIEAILKRSHHNIL